MVTTMDMNSYLVRALCSTIVFYGYLTVTQANLKVRVERHYPCSSSAGPRRENEVLRFPGSNSEVQLRTMNDDGRQCFLLFGGTVQVNSPGLIAGRRYDVHLETQIGIQGRPEPCVGADRFNCGGIGSCVHCDMCSLAREFSSYVQLYRERRPAQCGREGLTPGPKDDMAVKLCLPEKNEFLRMLDSDRNRALSLWNSFIKGSSSTKKSGGLPLVIFMRVFDRQMNRLTPSQLQDALHGRKTGQIACHWLYLTLNDL